jgi:thymidylate synthase (FAD)
MKVELLKCDSLELIDIAVGKCWNMPSKDEAHMLKRMDRVVNQNRHGSVSEHLSMTWNISKVSRALLQEFARHRIGCSLSVESSRYTLNKLKELPAFEGKNYKKATDFVKMTGNVKVDNRSIAALNALQEVIKMGIPNDEAKYCMPESFYTTFVSTMNIRSFKHFYGLRTSPAALKEIRELAEAMYEVLPDKVKFLIKEK